MKVYHYTHFDNLDGIQNGSYKDNYEPGLATDGRMGMEDDEAHNTCAIFALFEPLPKNWVNNTDFPGVWNKFLHDMGTLLLEIDIEPEENKAFVVDWGHCEGGLMLLQV